MRTFFVYDGINVVGEFNVGAAMSAWQMWGPTGLVARRKMLVNNNPGWTAAATSYYQYDPRGNLVHQQSTTGTVDDDYGHTAYGERVAEGSTVTFGRSDGPVGYGGQFGYQTDPETGLILCGFRYYDPKNGRWLTRDPIGYAGGVNHYAYTANNPVNWGDPQGLDPYRAVWDPRGYEFHAQDWIPGMNEGSLASLDTINPLGAPYADLGYYRRDAPGVRGSEISTQVALVAGEAYFGVLTGGIPASTPIVCKGGLEVVTRWGPEGKYVMRGGASLRNYVKSGVAQKWVMSGFQKYGPSQRVTRLVPQSALKAIPNNWYKTLIGQRILVH